MRIDPNSKITLEKLHLITGKSLEECRQFCEAMLAVLVMNFMEHKVTPVPFFGNITLKHIKDILVDGKKEPIVRIDIESSEMLLRNIRQLNNQEESEIEKFLFREIKQGLKKKAIK